MPWKAAKQEGVECLVAPFEADAQLAYLARKNYVAAVVTEDSDLLAFGTPKVLYKMNDFGEARLMVLDNILGHKKGKLDLAGLDQDRFTECCILAGCDYLDSIPGFGFSRAVKEVKKCKTVSRLFKVLRHLEKHEKKVKMPDNYEENFSRSLIAFKHHFVFCHESGGIVNLNPIPPTLEVESASSIPDADEGEQQGAPKSVQELLEREPPPFVPETPSPPPRAPRGTQRHDTEVIDLDEEEIEHPYQDLDETIEESDGEEVVEIPASGASQPTVPPVVEPPNYTDILGEKFTKLEAKEICFKATLNPKTKKPYGAPKAQAGPVTGQAGSPAHPPGNWICPKCPRSKANYPNRPACWTCGADRPPPPKPKGPGIRDRLASQGLGKKKVISGVNPNAQKEFKNPTRLKPQPSSEELGKKDSSILGLYGNSTAAVQGSAVLQPKAQGNELKRFLSANPFSRTAKEMDSPNGTATRSPTGEDSVLLRVVAAQRVEESPPASLRQSFSVLQESSRSPKRSIDDESQSPAKKPRTSLLLPKAGAKSSGMRKKGAKSKGLAARPSGNAKGAGIGAFFQKVPK